MAQPSNGMNLKLSLLFCFLAANTYAANKVTFSSPTSNSSVTSPTAVSVSAQGTPATFTLYVDGQSNTQVSDGNSINASVTLAAGTHTLTATARYSRRSSSSASVQVTVSSGSGGSTGGSGGSTGGGSATSVAQQIASDMSGQNEGQPHGVPSGWFQASLVNGNTLPGAAIEAWGGLYVGPNGNPATNTLVNIQDFAVYVLSKSTGKWTTYDLSASDNIDGGFYSETFSVDYGSSVPFRHESDGSLSFNTESGKVAHFYGPWPRIATSSSDFGGLVVTLNARLVLNNASGADDRSIASYVLDVGADPYPSTTGPGIENNPGIGMGKFKFVETGWRSFSMSTLSEAELAANPPPVSFTGINP
jgi:hypothetical protein